MTANKKKIICIMSFILLIVLALCLLFLKDDNSSNYNKISINKKTETDIKKKNNKHTANKSLIDTKKNNNTNNNTNNNVCHHTFVQDGYYVDTAGWGNPEDVAEICKDVNCVYYCKNCGKDDMYRDDINSVDDLRNHLKECKSNDPEFDVDMLSDEEVMKFFELFKEVKGKEIDIIKKNRE